MDHPPLSDLDEDGRLHGGRPIEFPGSRDIRHEPYHVFSGEHAGAGGRVGHLDLNNNGAWDGLSGGDAAYNFGAPGDIPVVGDWNGDGRSKFGVFRPSTGQFILDAQGHKMFDASSAVFNFGASGDIPVSFNATKRIGVFRPSTGQWILHMASPMTYGDWVPSDAVFQFGASGDQPVVGFWTMP